MSRMLFFRDATELYFQKTIDENDIFFIKIIIILCYFKIFYNNKYKGKLVCKCNLNAELLLEESIMVSVR